MFILVSKYANMVVVNNCISGDLLEKLETFFKFQFCNNTRIVGSGSSVDDINCLNFVLLF